MNSKIILPEENIKNVDRYLDFIIIIILCVNNIYLQVYKIKY